jgi:exopolysaccharide biosynthesis polyprenyl glycosylphosphotransferase
MIATGRRSASRFERFTTVASESDGRNFYPETPAMPRKRRLRVSRELFRRVVALSEMLADFVTCIASIAASYYIDLSLHARMQIQYPWREVAAVSSLVGLSVVLLLQRGGEYRGETSLLRIRESERAIRIPAQSLLLLLPFSLLLKLNLSYAAFPVAFLLTSALLILEKQLACSIVLMLHAREDTTHRVVVYGEGGDARRVASTLLYSRRIGLDPVAVIDDEPAPAGGRLFDMGYRQPRSVPVHRGPVTAALLKSCRSDMLLVAMPHLTAEKLSAAAHAAKQAGLQIRFLFDSSSRKPRESTEANDLLLTPTTEHVVPSSYAVAKRAADLTVSSVLFVMLTPLLLLIGLLVRLDSPGPALFVQKRVGRNGKLFEIYKFRSMYTNASKYDFSPTTSFDPRITRLGRFLRRSCLDELPQLMNVLRGTMSLVGPRPEMPFIVRSYNSRQQQRLQVTPGITGMWQLSADRGLPIHENVEYDLYYIRNRTFFMDIAILIHTLFFAVGGGV